jgi:hypothetical protein
MPVELEEESSVTRHARGDRTCTDFDSLLDDALCVLAYHRHASPVLWETLGTPPNQHVRTTCPACRMSVDVIQRPDADGMNICGAAAASRCRRAAADYGRAVTEDPYNLFILKERDAPPVRYSSRTLYFAVKGMFGGLIDNPNGAALIRGPNVEFWIDAETMRTDPIFTKIFEIAVDNHEKERDAAITRVLADRPKVWPA